MLQKILASLISSVLLVVAAGISYWLGRLIMLASGLHNVHILPCLILGLLALVVILVVLALFCVIYSEIYDSIRKKDTLDTGP